MSSFLSTADLLGDNICVETLLDLGNVENLELQGWDMDWGELDPQLLALLNIGNDENELKPNVEFEFANCNDFFNIEEFSIEQQLAKLDGGPNTEIPLTDANADQCLGTSSNTWYVVQPLTTISTVLVSRLCFGRVIDNNYKIYDVLDNIGYHHWGTIFPLNAHGINDLKDGHRLSTRYLHIYKYKDLPERIKQLMDLERGVNLPNLLSDADRLCVDTNRPCTLSTDDTDITCVGSAEMVHVTVKSSIVRPDQVHSGFNIFGEAARISLTILDKELVLQNDAIVSMTNKPEMPLFFYLNYTNIYVLSGRILLEQTEFAKHILPIQNVELIPYSPPDAVSVP